MDKDIAKKIALGLLKIGAIRLSPEEPFTWASGWKSPIYCDNRKVLSHPELRTYVKDAFCELVKQRHGSIDSIAAVATAGIAHGALLADALNMPFVYVRSKAKAHGMKNMIEGDENQVRSCVLIEDLISTGGSSVNAAIALQEAGIDVRAVYSIFNYGFREAELNFKSKGLAFGSLSNYDTLIDSAIEIGLVRNEQVEILKSWRTNPSEWP